MSSDKVITNSKLIAEYLGWKYIPFSKDTDLKPGWYKREERKDPGTKQSDLIKSDGSSEKLDLNPLFIIDGSKKKGGWFIREGMYWKYVCRKHNQLRFYNSFDWLISAIEKLESEELTDRHYKWDQGEEERSNFMSLDFNIWKDESYFSIELQLDPSYEIGSGKGGGIIKNTFNAVVEAIKYIKDE